MKKDLLSKRYRISSSLAVSISQVKETFAVTTGIDFKSKKNGRLIRLSPIVLHIREKMITAHIAKESGSNINFSDVESEWFEFIEATFKMLLTTSLVKNLS